MSILLKKLFSLRQLLLTSKYADAHYVAGPMDKSPHTAGTEQCSPTYIDKICIDIIPRGSTF